MAQYYKPSYYTKVKQVSLRSPHKSGGPPGRRFVHAAVVEIAGGLHGASSSRAAASWASSAPVLYTSASRVRPVPMREVPLPVK